MASGNQGPHPEGVASRQDAGGGWRREWVNSGEDATRVIEAVLAEMGQRGYAPAACERLRREIEEAVRSALEQSRRTDPSRPAAVGYRVGEDAALVEVEGRELGAAQLALQGPHASQVLQTPAEGAPFGARSYTWLRCGRRTGQLLVCKHLALP